MLIFMLITDDTGTKNGPKSFVFISPCYLINTIEQKYST